MSSGSGFDISDAFNDNVASWAAKGVIAPLDQFIKADNYSTSDFVPSALQTGQYNSHTYALPIAMHDTMLLYNKTLFKQAGITNPPQTTDQLLTDMQKLTVVKNGQMKQLGLSSYDYTTMSWVFGGHLINAQNQPTPTDPGVIAAYNFYVDNVIKKYGVNEIQKFTSGFGQYQSPQNPFYVGKVAMTMDGEWQPQFIKEYAPNLKWGAVPLPYPTGHPELANTSQVTSSVFFIPENSKHKQQAWEFLKYLESPQVMTKFDTALQNIPARTSLLDSPKFTNLGMKPWLEEAKSKNLHILPEVPWLDQYTQDLATETSNITLLKESTEQGMKKVKQDSTQYGN
jgi:multiple sugar transport system substrate-binding protein